VYAGIQDFFKFNKFSPAKNMKYLYNSHSVLTSSVIFAFFHAFTVHLAVDYLMEKNGADDDLQSLSNFGLLKFFEPWRGYYHHTR
jgi:hypothetical protein